MPFTPTCGVLVKGHQYHLQCLGCCLNCPGVTLCGWQDVKIQLLTRLLFEGQVDIQFFLCPISVIVLSGHKGCNGGYKGCNRVYKGCNRGYKGCNRGFNPWSCICAPGIFWIVELVVMKLDMSPYCYRWNVVCDLSQFSKVSGWQSECKPLHNLLALAPFFNFRSSQLVSLCIITRYCAQKVDVCWYYETGYLDIQQGMELWGGGGG